MNNMLNFMEAYYFSSNNSDSSNNTNSTNSTDTENYIEMTINYVLTFILFISFLINLIIILIHQRQPFFRQGFFKIVLIQIILEAIINLSSIIIKIFYMIDVARGKWFLIFPTIFNFCYMTNILYNIRIIYFLNNYNKDRDDLINYDLRDNNSNNSFTRQESISLDQESFKKINIFSFSISFIYIIGYLIYFLMIKDGIESTDWKWYYYYLVGENESYWILISFFFHIVYFFFSVPYCCKSLNKGKVTNHILLKNYSIYGVLSSFISLLFPITFIVNKIYLFENFHYVISFGFLCYIIFTCNYRIHCYYITYILNSKGEGFFKRCAFGFRILFCCQKIPVPNFIDLNSSFIFQSLANFNDFLGEENTPNEEMEIK